MKRIAALLLVLAMICSMLPQVTVSAGAEEDGSFLNGVSPRIRTESTYPGTRLGISRMLYG